ncbi:hypothetical protein AQI95_28980 [Streptomyces yokosukanensis]|uniref:PknH-like extracellular domain-containing protein n=1 Tax=Streptomyces yokosukanensis TaxID=67386 RepID=A0A117Q0M9_9ACTN|nr:hypothetical protein [Streptomyces yokosukanensis]KUN02112.1 hypothetical protein AQI95_28980 [Streptomyces yokosukanensis]
MRVRITTSVLGVTAVSALGLTAVAVLALPACSARTSKAKPSATAATRTGKPAFASPKGAPLSSAAMTTRLLDENDLGSGYTRKPESPSQHDDVNVLGCPALNGLGSDAATGGPLAFPHQAKADFTYTGSSNSEVSEELYSDTAARLSAGTSRIFDAMTGCPHYQLLVGGTTIEVATQRLTAPRLGDEQWSQLLTFSADGRDTVVKQTAIRDGSVLVDVSGSPALVDRHLGKALAKATAAH